VDKTINALTGNITTVNSTTLTNTATATINNLNIDRELRINERNVMPSGLSQMRWGEGRVRESNAGTWYYLRHASSGRFGRDVMVLIGAGGGTEGMNWSNADSELNSRRIHINELLTVGTDGSVNPPEGQSMISRNTIKTTNIILTGGLTQTGNLDITGSNRLRFNTLGTKGSSNDGTILYTNNTLDLVGGKSSGTNADRRTRIWGELRVDENLNVDKTMTALTVNTTNATITGTLGITGATTASTLTTTGNITINGTSGRLILGGGVTKGESTTDGTIVYGTANTLEIVGGKATGTANANRRTRILGELRVDENLNVDKTINTATLNISSSSGINNKIRFNGTHIDVMDDIYMGNKSIFNCNNINSTTGTITTLNSTTSTTSNITITGTSGINGKIRFNGADIDVSKTIHMTNNSILNCNNITSTNSTITNMTTTNINSIVYKSVQRIEIPAFLRSSVNFGNGQLINVDFNLSTNNLICVNFYWVGTDITFGNKIPDNFMNITYLFNENRIRIQFIQDNWAPSNSTIYGFVFIIQK
jgi:hypothetical protein